MSKNPYITMWGTEDVLNFYGTFLSFIGTVSLGAIALWQNKKANEINMRILKLEELSNVPFLHIDASNSKINCMSSHEVDIIIGLSNKSHRIINISEVSDVKYQLSSSPQENILPFCEDWIKHYSVLPDQVIQIDFFKDANKNERPIIDGFDEIDKEKFFQMNCNFSVIVSFVNAREKYKQQYELTLHCYTKGDARNFIMSIYNVENSIVIQEEK